MAALSRQFGNHERHPGAQHSQNKEREARQNQDQQPQRVTGGHKGVAKQNQGRDAAEVAAAFPEMPEFTLPAAHPSFEGKTVQHLEDPETDGDQYQRGGGGGGFGPGNQGRNQSRMVLRREDAQILEQVAKEFAVDKPPDYGPDDHRGHDAHQLRYPLRGQTHLEKIHPERPVVSYERIQIQGKAGKNQPIADIADNHADPKRKQGGSDPGRVPTIVARGIQKGDQGFEGPDPGGVFQHDRNTFGLMMGFGGFESIQDLVFEAVQNLQNPMLAIDRHPTEQRKAVTPGGHGPEGVKPVYLISGAHPKTFQLLAGSLTQMEQICFDHLQLFRCQPASFPQPRSHGL